MLIPWASWSSTFQHGCPCGFLLFSPHGHSIFLHYKYHHVSLVPENLSGASHFSQHQMGTRYLHNLASPLNFCFSNPSTFPHIIPQIPEKHQDPMKPHLEQLPSMPLLTTLLFSLSDPVTPTNRAARTCSYILAPSSPSLKEELGFAVDFVASATVCGNS